MNDLLPLAEQPDVPDHALALLRSAEDDAPPAGADAALLASLHALPKPFPKGPLMALMAMGAVGTALLLTTGGTSLVRAPSETVRHARIMVTQPDPVPMQAPGISVESLPLAAPSAAPVRLPGGDGLDEVDRARAALQADPAQTLRLAAAYRRAHPDRRYAVEVDALEVQALAALHRPGAAAAADRFFAQHPGSAYTQRVRAAVEAKP